MCMRLFQYQLPACELNVSMFRTLQRQYIYFNLVTKHIVPQFIFPTVTKDMHAYTHAADIIMMLINRAYLYPLSEK